MGGKVNSKKIRDQPGPGNYDPSYEATKEKTKSYKIGASSRASFIPTGAD
jgi:hypothetical protein